MVSNSVTDGLVYGVSGAGHREEYIRLFAGLLGLSRIEGKLSVSVALRLLGARRVLFATVDDTVFGYILVAFTRSLFGRRTAGLFMRPHACLEPGLKAAMKRCLFLLLKRSKHSATLAIIPFELKPGISSIVDNWIHDPQLWDGSDLSIVVDRDVSIALKQAAQGRPILSFLGGVSRIKGFPLLVSMMAGRPELMTRFHIVIAGVVESDCADLVQQMEKMGATVMSRRISDAQMAAIYSESALIWACYDPSYDQASGIFGRAVQRGKATVLRQGSMITKYAEMLSSEVLCIPFDANVGADILIDWEHERNMHGHRSAAWRNESVRILQDSV